MERDSLLRKLIDYGAGEFYPFHMPGHKRRWEEEPLCFPNPFSVDITEIEGFDNLHHPEGILRDSMRRAAEIYGSDRTYYLVNGSSCGILSALSACVKPGGRFLMARNSHKAAYHAVFLNNLDPVYVYPEIWEEFQIQGGISPEQIERLLEKEKGIQAVFITSPTYEGIVSDVAGIAALAHARHIPLIVDEAHGAHLSFGNNRFPASALDCGADAVIQSLHKTLPSLTQTAVLHLKSRLIRPEQVERYLSMFQSSSPSYVFLASMENCIRYMEREGRERMERFADSLDGWYRRGAELRNLRLLPMMNRDRCPAVKRDPSKLVVSVLGTGLTGTGLAGLLRQRYHLEPEMSCRGYVLFMTSLMDTEQGLNRLAGALEEIDRELTSIEAAVEKAEEKFGEKAGEMAGEMAGEKVGETVGEKAVEEQAVPQRDRSERPERRMSIFEAGHADCESVEINQAAGRISGDFLTVYPPGVPALVPGERITEEAVRLLLSNHAAGLTVEGLKDGAWVSVVVNNGVKEE